MVPRNSSKKTYLDISQYIASVGLSRYFHIQDDKLHQLPAVYNRLKWLPPVLVGLQHDRHAQSGQSLLCIK